MVDGYGSGGTPPMRNGQPKNVSAGLIKGTTTYNNWAWLHNPEPTYNSFLAIRWVSSLKPYRGLAIYIQPPAICHGGTNSGSDPESLTSRPDAERLVDTLVESEGRLERKVPVRKVEGGEGKGRMIILTRMMIDN